VRAERRLRQLNRLRGSALRDRAPRKCPPGRGGHGVAGPGLADHGGQGREGEPLETPGIPPGIADDSSGWRPGSRRRGRIRAGTTACAHRARAARIGSCREPGLPAGVAVRPSRGRGIRSALPVRGTAPCGCSNELTDAMILEAPLETHGANGIPVEVCRAWHAAPRLGAARSFREVEGATRLHANSSSGLCAGRYV